MAPTPNKESAKGACNDTSEAMPFLAPSQQDKLDYANLPLTKSSCWVAHKKEGYVRAEVTSTDGDTCQIESSKGDKSSAPKAEVLYSNPGKFEQATDMADMTHLNEATVLHNLASRYRVLRIYTYSGLFCVCVNPYKWLPIYGDVIVNMYRGKKRTECPPHLYSIADNAYQDMLRERQCQSILITGESGAGKTENTKKVIGYMAAVAAGGARKEGEVGLEDQIVQTNPILEAWGNAKTIRNNNSSRFGKFIRVHFGNTGKLSGGDIEVYLLEKSRVVYQLSAERNYHIFYQIMYCKKPEVLKMCMISENPKDYYWAGQMGVIVVDRMDDTFEFNCTTEAFKILGFSDSERDDSYKISSAVIMMGDMKYTQKPRDEQAEMDTLDVADKVAHLLGMGSADMCKAFTRPRIKVGTEMVTKGQNVAQCTGATGAIAKAVFDKLFQWLVKMCNRTLDTDLPRSFFCGVLDIAGFEIFDFNTFEQLCINFTNEKLQQFFNHNMFVLEQEEYMREGIEWEMMNFGMDLQACIDLLEKPMGVFAILEEQSIVPKATDETFKAKLYETHEKKNPAFVKPKVGKKSVAHFICKHYAGDVGYNLDGWLDKNKDPLNPSVVELLQKSKWGLVKVLFAAAPEADSGGGKKKKKKGGSMQTVGGLYKQQLNSLMSTLRSTKPSFVRCIVPNEIKTPAVVEANLILHQLRCNGVLEGIRICRKGFPNRALYPEFFQRYKILAAAKLADIVDSKAATEIILKHIELAPTLFKIGKSKVFFKAGTLADLEEMRDNVLAVIISKIQARARGKLMRVEFQKMLIRVRATKCIQSNIRKFLQFRDWGWWLLFTRVKPLLKNAQAEEEAKKKEAEMMEKMAALEKDAEAMKDLETKVAQLLKEKNELTLKLQAEEDGAGDIQERLDETIKQKSELESDLAEANETIEKTEGQLAKMTAEKKKLEESGSNLSSDLSTAEANISKLEGDKKNLDLKVRNLTADLEAREASITSLQTEKKKLEGVNAQILDDLSSMEDKANSLTKVKAKLEQQLEETEDNLGREKKSKADLDKVKRKLDGELKNARENISTLEADKQSLEDGLRKKDLENKNLSGRIDDTEASLAGANRKIKELNSKCEEIEGELDNERAAKQKVEKARNDLVHEMQTLTEQLEEAGGATAAQVELIKKREADFAKLRSEFEEATLKADNELAAIKKKSNDALAEMGEQIENVTRLKNKAEKDRQGLIAEVDDLTTQVDDLSKGSQRVKANLKSVEEQLSDHKARLEDASRANQELASAKQKLQNEAQGAAAALEDAESKVSQLSRAKSSLSSMVEQLKAQVEEEGKGKQSLNHALHAARHDIELIREQMEEESEGKAELQRALSKANAEVTSWRSKYENDAIAKMEEVEDAKKKLALRLQEAEEATENALSKAAGLEKSKIRIVAENEDLQANLDQANVTISNLDKKQRKFDKEMAGVSSKVEELSAELDGAKKESRNFQTEIYKLKQAHDEAVSAYDSLKKDNRALSDEVAELSDQLSTGGKSLHEISKARKKAEADAEEMKAALDEAEGALELEASRVLRLQLEMSQFKAELDRKLQEKDEEFDSTRKNHSRALESMQATLDAEIKARTDATRAKKNMESAVNDLELSLDSVSKKLEESSKNAKKYQTLAKEAQDAADAASVSASELQDQATAAERKAQMLQADFDDMTASLDSNERARKAAESDLYGLSDQLAALTSQNSALTSQKRKLENEVEALRGDAEEASEAVKSAEDKAKKAAAEAGKAADALRAAENHNAALEKGQKNMQAKVHELSMKLDEAEAAGAKGSRQAVSALQAQLNRLEADYDAEVKKNADTLKNYRKAERKMKELVFKTEEDAKNNSRMNELVTKLQAKVKQYKTQSEEAEAQANENLRKYRQINNELAAAEERAEASEAALSKLRRSGGAGGSGGSYIPHKSVYTKK